MRNQIEQFDEFITLVNLQQQFYFVIIEMDRVRKGVEIVLIMLNCFVERVYLLELVD